MEETHMENGKVDGPYTTVLGDEFFTQSEPLQQKPEDIDLNDYRAGQSTDLGDFVSLPVSRQAEIRKPRTLEWFQTYSMQAIEKVWTYHGEGINEVYLVKKDVVA